MKKTVYVGFKFSHMGAHAGYDLVRFYAGYDIIIDCQKDYAWQQKFFVKNNLFSKFCRKVFGARLWWVELRCLLLALKHKNLTFHFAYAENVYRYLGFFKWLGFKVVGTYHQPASFFEKMPSYLQGVKKLDGVIGLSEESVIFFKEKAKCKNVAFIPHGVDSDYFCPNNVISRKKEVLMVGNWLRDFSFANKVFAVLLKQDPDVVVHVVSSKKNHRYFDFNERLVLHSDITDEDLLFRYRSAALLFLPLEGFVANNAVLETAAAGCQIVIASDQEPENLMGSLIKFIPLNIESALNNILALLGSPANTNLNLREYVVRNFSWHAVGAETRKFISAI